VTAITAWRCPKCGRSVPRTVEVCRCGHQRAGSEEPVTIGTHETPVAPPVVPSQLGPARGPSTLLLMAVALAVGVGAAYVFLRPTAAPATVPVHESAGEAPKFFEDPPPASDAQSQAAQPQWPTDPALFKQPPSSSAASPAASADGAARAQPAPRSVEDVVSSAIPAVVLVDTTEGRGTGFFVSSDTVVTNAHVVDGATYVTLRGGTGDQTPAMVTSRNTDLDLAVLHVSKAKAGQPVLQLGSSGDVRVGQEIVAIGSPMGLQNTVTRGIVSSLRRVGQVTLIQTDAAINPGNSGGPLLDHNGRVVAVATMKLTGQAESLGFGVAAEHVHAMLDGSAPASSGHRMVDSMNNNTSTSDPDADRNDATEGYERFISEAAKKADQIDRSWETLVGQCLSGRGPSSHGDRDWFAIWEGFDDSKVSAGCSDYYGDLKAAALMFRRRMGEAADAARRAGVYPGQARDIRHQYRIDSPAW
jgi:S1-C subfamily serine protease